MGNIKHNDELLRVHDDGFDVVFNCDNKHQNGVSYHAEKNGKKTKIDPEYAMAALVKKVSGAGWPADLPVPSAGGYGYTESGEQTVITWDGDTEGRDIISISMQGMTINYCKVAEKGTGYTDTAKYTEYGGDHVAHLLNGDGAIAYFTDLPVVIIADGGEFSLYNGLVTGTAPSSGVYFVYLDGNDNTSSLTYGTPDTVHKIDEKYLPEISPTDEVLENAKETGGIGWTESNEELILQGSETADSSGVANISVPSEAFFQTLWQNESNIKVVINGVAHNNCYVDSDYEQYVLKSAPDELLAVQYYPGYSYVGFLFLQPNEPVNIQMYIQSDTVHKIDDKYLSTVEKAKEIGGIAYTEFVENENIMYSFGTFHDNCVHLKGRELVLDEKYSCHIELTNGSDQVVINAEGIVAEGNAGDYEHIAYLEFTDDDNNVWNIVGSSNPETDAPNTMAYTISCYDMDLDEDINIFVLITGPCNVVHTINPKYVPIEKGTGFYGTSCMLHDDITPDSAPGTEITYYPPSDFRLYDITVSEAIQRGVYVSAKIAIKVRSGAQTNTVNANLTFSEVGQTTLGRVCYFAGFSRPTDAVNDIYYVCMALPDFPEEHNNKATLMAIKKLTLS